MRIISRQPSYFLQFVQIFRLFLTADMLFWLFWTLPPSMNAASYERTLFFLWTQRRWQASPFSVSLINVEWFPWRLRSTSGVEPRSGSGTLRLSNTYTHSVIDRSSWSGCKRVSPKKKTTFYLTFKNLTTKRKSKKSKILQDVQNFEFQFFKLKLYDVIHQYIHFNWEQKFTHN